MKETEGDTDGKIHHVLGLEDSIVLKWLHYPMAFFKELEQTFFCVETQKPKQSWERKMELEESGSLASDYTTKL